MLESWLAWSCVGSQRCCESMCPMALSHPKGIVSLPNLSTLPSFCPSPKWSPSFGKRSMILISFCDWTFLTDFLSSQTNSLVRSGSCTGLWAQRYEFRGQCDVRVLNNSSGFPLGLMSFSSHDLGQIYSTRLMFPPLKQVLNPPRDWSANPLALL